MLRETLVGGSLVAVWLVASSSGGSGARLPQPAPLDATRPISYSVGDTGGVPGHRPADRTLARWALEAWERAAGGALRFREVPEPVALIRLAWVPASGGMYGEMRPMQVDGRRGAIVFIRPVTGGLGAEMLRRAQADPLYRDAVVYLTCLHELGHALGLEHTRAYADIMYFFGYGGDVPAFFSRYYEMLESTSDIRRVSGLSADDVRRLRRLYPSPDRP